MSTSKRAALFTVRCITLIIALGFLVFYVWRAQGKQNALFSSSKNLRSAYPGETQAAGQWILEHASSDPDAAPTPMPSPSIAAPSLTPDANADSKTMFDPFQFGLFAPPPETLSGSKSMSQPVVDGADVMRFWTLHSDKIFHSFGPPFSRETAADVRFSEPSIRVHIDEIEKGAEPPGTSSTTPATSPEPAPQSPTPAEP